MDKEVPRSSLEDNDRLLREVVLRHVIRLHEALATESGTKIFFDRGLIDQFAFFCVSRIPDVSMIIEASLRFRYDQVFVLEPLPFVPDGLRTEDPERRERLHDSILSYSVSLGYEPVRVPALELDARVEFVLERAGRAQTITSNRRVRDSIASVERLVKALKPSDVLY